MGTRHARRRSFKPFPLEAALKVSWANIPNDAEFLTLAEVCQLAAIAAALVKGRGDAHQGSRQPSFIDLPNASGSDDMLLFFPSVSPLTLE